VDELDHYLRDAYAGIEELRRRMAKVANQRPAWDRTCESRRRWDTVYDQMGAMATAIKAEIAARMPM
jgi:hypothetical protein